MHLQGHWPEEQDPDLEPDPNRLFTSSDPTTRIRTKMSRISNTALLILLIVANFHEVDWWIVWLLGFPEPDEPEARPRVSSAVGGAQWSHLPWGNNIVLLSIKMP